MKAFAGFVVATLLALTPLAAARALESSQAEISLGLVPFSSDEGMARLARSDAKVNFPALANQFEAEYNQAFCGPASSAMVLNAMRSGAADLPRDTSRIRPDDLKYLPPGAEAATARYTQDIVIEKASKTRAQVLGEPVTINGRTVHDFGFQTRQLDEMLRANGLSTRLVIVDDAKPDAEVRADLVQSLRQRGHYVIVSFQRKALSEPGGGHISPLGAYDAASDSFLMLDVNPARVDWMWVPAAALIKSMRTFDTVENRGYVLIEPQ
jgi:Phytochelatin synthase